MNEMKFVCPNCNSERIAKYSLHIPYANEYELITDYSTTGSDFPDTISNKSLQLVCLICKHLFFSDEVKTIEVNEEIKINETIKNHLKYLKQTDKMKAITYCKNILGYSLQESINIIQHL